MRKWLFAMLPVFTLAMPRLAQACAMCGLSPGDHEAHAFNSSVLFMMAAPYSIVLIIAAVLVLAYRNAARKRGIRISFRRRGASQSQ